MVNLESAISDMAHGQFNLVLVSGLIEHLHDPIRAIQNARKLLVVGGTAIVTTAGVYTAGSLPPVVKRGGLIPVRILEASGGIVSVGATLRSSTKLS